VYRIVFYQTASGKNYVMAFLETLPKKVQIKMAARIKYLEDYGHDARRPYVAPLRNKVFELRLSFGRLEPRILYFFDRPDIVLTHGFLKKTDAVSEGEIDRAIRIMHDYKTR